MKKNIIIFIMAVIICILAVFIIFNNRNNGKKYIGTWELTEGTTTYLKVIELFEGGTGKGYQVIDGEKGTVNLSGKIVKDSYYSLNWEIKDNIINIKCNDTTKGYKLESKNILKSVDERITYNKADK